MMLDTIRRYLVQNRERMLGELLSICSIPTYSSCNPSEFLRCEDFLRHLLTKNGFSVSVLPTDGHNMLFAEQAGVSPRTLLFYNHFDVVAPGDRSRWNTDPFDPQIRNGSIYCRGVSDHKGSLMARIHAAEALSHCMGSLPVTTKFLIESDEESLSPYLRETALCHRELLSADGCLYPGWRRDEAERVRINTGSRGSFLLRLVCRTAKQDLHEAYAPLVPHALVRLIQALGCLFDEQQNVAADGFYSGIRRDRAMEEAAEKIPFDAAVFLQKTGAVCLLGRVEGREAVLRNLFWPTLSVCSVTASSPSKDVLPSCAEATLRCLTVPRQNADFLRDALRRHLDLHGFTDLELSPPEHRIEPSYTPGDDPLVQAVLEAGRLVYGQMPILVPVSSGSGPKDVFSELLGIPTVADVGCGNSRSNDHGANENIRVEDYFQNIAHIAEIMIQFSKTAGLHNP